MTAIKLSGRKGIGLQITGTQAARPGPAQPPRLVLSGQLCYFYHSFQRSGAKHYLNRSISDSCGVLASLCDENGKRVLKRRPMKHSKTVILAISFKCNAEPIYRDLIDSDERVSVFCCIFKTNVAAWQIFVEHEMGQEAAW